MSLTVKLGEDWERVQKLSVIVAGPREGGPYVRDDFRKGREAVTGPVSRHVLSFGPLAKNSEWYLVLADQPSKDSLLLAQNVCVLKKGKEIMFRVSSADKAQFNVKVHWAPPFVPNSILSNLLGTTQLCLDLDRSQIDCSHRLGYRSEMPMAASSPPKPRPVIVKLTSYETRKLIFNN